MAERPTRTSSESSSADVATAAVDTHRQGRIDHVRAATAPPVPALKDHRAAPDAPGNRATFQKHYPKTPCGNSSTLAITSTQHHSSPSPREPNLAHLAALRRLNGNSSLRGPLNSSGSRSSTSSEPVLVRTYSSPSPEVGSSKQAQMNKNRKSRMDIKSPDLPPLESFSFQDILASIDPEVKVSIDAIAEICSRSKLSLADEYGSHLPPQAQFIAPYGQGQNCGATPTHLDTLHESPSMDLQVPVNQEHDQRNSVSLALITTANQRSAAMSSAPTAVTSMVHSEPLMEFSSHEPTRASNAESDLQSSTLPHVLAWLRRSSASLTGLNDLSHLDDRDASAVDTLNRILAKSKGTLEPAT